MTADDCDPLPPACSAACASQFASFYGSCAAQIEDLDNAVDMAAFLTLCQAPPVCCSTLCYVCGSGTACDGCDGSCNSAGMDYCDGVHPEWDENCDRSC